jgi:hypothetical protein
VPLGLLTNGGNEGTTSNTSTTIARIKEVAAKLGQTCPQPRGSVVVTRQRVLQLLYRLLLLLLMLLLLLLLLLKRR